jgi:hypothetical protein
VDDPQPTIRPDSLPPVEPTTRDADVESPETVGVGQADTVAVPAPTRGLPGYEIVEELGRGAMGVVYRARQVSLKRDVALKMILAGGHAGEQERQRFMAEAEVIASVQHPGIVQVFDFGTSDGLPYLVLEFCPGSTLAARLAGKPLPPTAAARLIAQIADAVQAAHERGVVHRDLKPGNVLLTADGSPKVADFGLARRGEGSGMTLSGAVMGTPAYMAPEQARGLKAVGPAADVYALGVMLYEALTGRVPFKGETAQDTLMRTLTDAPPPPRSHNAAVPAALEAVCLKCLEKDPAKRYASAKELAEELRNFLAGRPVVAQAKSAPPRRTRAVVGWVLVAVAAGVLLPVLVAAGLVAAFLVGPRESKQPREPNATNSAGPQESVVNHLVGQPPPPPSDPPLVKVKGGRHALLVGVNEFRDPAFATLKYCDADVESLAEVLGGESGGFTVRVLNTARGKRDPKDAPTAANVRRELAALAANRKRADVILFVAAGTGAQLTVKDPGGKDKERSFAFFCPADADFKQVGYRTGRSDRLLNLNHLMTQMGQSGAGFKLALFDACRNEHAARGTDAPGEADPGSGDGDVRVPRGVAAFFSCKSGQFAYESDKLRHGIFIHSVLQALTGKAKNEDGEATWDGLTAYVKRQVSRDVPVIIGGGAQQTPHVVSNLEGDPVLAWPGRKVVRDPAAKDDGDEKKSIGIR